SLSLNKDVIAGRAVENILAQAANQNIVANSTDENVIALAADQDIVALAAVLGELDSAGLQTGRVDDIVAGGGFDNQLVIGCFRAGDVHQGGQASDRHAVRVTVDEDGVVTARAIDDDGIRLAVADASAGRPRQVEIDPGDVGAGQIVDRDGVGAALGVEVDSLDIVEVHDDVADVSS